MYNARVVCDSINPSGQRITTLELTYPRIVHSEVLTHRDRERNSASSRAIPWAKMSERILENPFIPFVWGSEQKGMQTGDAVSDKHAELAMDLWLFGRNFMVSIADRLHNIGKTYEDLAYGREPFLRGLGFDVEKYFDAELAGLDPAARIHKSLPNRLTEPWMWITVVMTATDWKNFFALRCHHMAEIHFQKIANMARECMEASTPNRLELGQWHLPYLTDEEYTEYWEEAKKVSVARCARVSYLTQNGVRDIEADLKLYERLRNPEGPPHASPMGHIAMAATSDVRSGPFRGWVQHRKEIHNECADNV